MSKKKMKTFVILLAMAGGLVLSPPMVAQNDGSRGCSDEEATMITPIGVRLAHRGC